MKKYLKYSWIPRRGILQNVEPFDCPPDGLTRCRNYNYSRKDGTLTRSKGKEKFTSAAASSGTSIRGIGVLDKDTNPSQFNLTHLIQCDSTTDDVEAVGAAGFTTNNSSIKAGKVASTTATSEIISTGSNDVYVNHDLTTIYTTTSSLYVGKAGASGDQFSAGLRFTTVAVAQGTTIASAYLRLFYEGSLTHQHSIYGEDADDSAAFSTYANFNGRTKTTANVNMPGQIMGWRTIDVTTIVQEIVSRASWASNNNMTFLIVYKSPYNSIFNIKSIEGGYNAQLTINVGSQASSDIGLFFEGFDNITQGATIYSARLKLKLKSQNGQPTLQLSGHDIDQSTTFTNRTNWDARLAGTDAGDGETTAKVAWTPDTDEMDVDTWIYSPDLKTIIQEIVDRTNWNDATDGDLSLFIRNNGTADDDTFLDVYAQDAAAADAPILEIETASTIPTNPKFYFWAASNADAFLYDTDDVTSAIDQAGKTWAFEKQNMLFRMVEFKDTDYTFNYLLSSDRKNNPQKLDRVAEDAATTDLHTDFKAKFFEIYQRRLFSGHLDISGVRYPKSVAYSAVTDPTSNDTTNQIQHLPGSDELTALAVMGNILNTYAAHSIWYLDYFPNASDPDKFPAYCHTTAFGHVGANIAKRGNIHFILTEQGIAAFGGGSDFEIISDGIRTDLEYCLRSNLANLVFMKYHPIYDELWVAMPIEPYLRNFILSRYSFKYGTWTQDDIKEANVLEYIFDPDDNYNGKMIFGAEDGILYKEGTEQNDGSAFSGDFISGPLFLAELLEVGDRRTRVHVHEIHVWENQALSTGINVYLKSGDYPWEWDDATWRGSYTLTSDARLPVLDQHGAWHGIKIESLESSEKSSISQVDFYFTPMEPKK